MAQKVEITHPDKILFPKSKITKGEIVEYYKKIAPKMLPKIKDRPISMLRYPNGITKEGFFQKNVSDYFPKWIKTCSIQREGKGNISMVICNDTPTLLYLANQACLTPHIWLSRKDKLNYPDRLIFDLDPSVPGAFHQVMEGAKSLRKILEKLGLKTFVMTTGSKGLHVVVPLKRDATFKEVRTFAREIAELLAGQEPEKYTTEQRINKRKKRIFIDYLRNGFAATGVAPYAVRAIEGAPVAAPLAWSEVKGGLSPQSFNIHNVLRRKDPWSQIERSARAFKPAMKRLSKMSRDIG